MSEEVAVRVKNLSKSFKLPHEKHGSIKSTFINNFRGRTTYEKQEVLKNISFEIKKGEFFGIVGRNGSGKSTLLKLLAGIYSPNKGAVQVNGKLTPFIELGVGFNPELTGRENVFLNGALLGFSRKEMEVIYDEIVVFAELEQFMDQKLKNYSSGMQVRLAFSIAIQAKGDILLLDEVLAVGDEAFQRKCFSYFAELKKQKKTVVLVTHSMESMQRFCSRALLLDSGNITVEGIPSKVSSEYQKLNLPISTLSSIRKEQNSDKERDLYFKIKLEIKNSNNKISNVISGNEKKIKFTLYLSPQMDIKDAFFGFTIRKSSGELIYWFTTEEEPYRVEQFIKGKKIKFHLEVQNIFGEGEYFVSASVKRNDRSGEYLVADDLARFEVVNRGSNGFMLHPTTKWEISQR